MGEPESAPVESASDETVASPPRRRRRRRSSASRSNVVRGRLRKLYFSLAAVWGFLIGTAAVLVGLAVLGRPLHLAPLVAIVLAGAALLAVVGGLIAATAYRDASKRIR